MISGDVENRSRSGRIKDQINGDGLLYGRVCQGMHLRVFGGSVVYSMRSAEALRRAIGQLPSDSVL